MWNINHLSGCPLFNWIFHVQSQFILVQSSGLLILIAVHASDLNSLYQRHLSNTLGEDGSALILNILSIWNTVSFLYYFRLNDYDVNIIGVFAFDGWIKPYENTSVCVRGFVRVVLKIIFIFVENSTHFYMRAIMCSLLCAWQRACKISRWLVAVRVCKRDKQTALDSH